MEGRRKRWKTRNGIGIKMRERGTEKEERRESVAGERIFLGGCGVVEDGGADGEEK